MLILQAIKFMFSFQHKNNYHLIKITPRLFLFNFKALITNNNR